MSRPRPRPFRFLRYVFAVAFGVAATTRAADRQVTLAILADPSLKDVPTVALLQEKLAGRDVRFVERDEVDKVLAEQALQAAFAPDGASPRVRLGAVLKADQLVLLRRQAPAAPAAPARPGGAPNPVAIEVVVCETARGLRLTAQAVAVGPDPAASVAAIEPVVSAAVRKGRGPIREIAAVPPFVSNDLTYRYESLKSAYARALEQMLLDDPQVLVVELEEARAIAREAALARERPGVRRPLPLYLLGEFRNEGAGDARTVSVTVTIRRGDRETGAVERRGVAPAAVPTLLRDAGNKALGSPPSAGAPRGDVAGQESRALASRAKLFLDVGSWAESLALNEASLLLDPRQVQPHHDAVIACARLARLRFVELAGARAEPAHVRRMADVYFQGLDHLEAFLREVPDLAPYRTPGRPTFLSDLRWSVNNWVVSGYPSKACLDELAACRARATEGWLRLARMRARDRRGDEADFAVLATSALPDAARYQVFLQLIREWEALPGNDKRVRRLAQHGVMLSALTMPDGAAFLDELARMDNPEIRATAEALRKEANAFVADEKQKAADWEAADTRRKAAEAAARAAGPPEIVFQPLKLTASRRGAGAAAAAAPTPVTSLVRCIPAGAGTDAFVSSLAIHVMREKGALETVWRVPENNARLAWVVFDGRYLWAPVVRFLKSPLLVIVDPVSGQSWEITERDGLPLKGIVDPNATRTVTEYVKVATLSPGRACVAGYFGRTWLAMVQFDPAKGPAAGTSVKVFHEARDQVNLEDTTQWRSPRVAFEPGRMCMLTEPTPVGQGELHRRRILIGRTAGAGDIRVHPLLVDPETLDVRVLEAAALWEESTAFEGTGSDSLSVHDGAAYWVWGVDARQGLPPGPAVFRLGFPDFKREVVGTQAYAGAEAAYRDKLFFHDGRVFLAARQWWVADGVGKPFRALRGDVPERMDRGVPPFYARHLATTRTRESTEGVSAVCPSNHYGVVCVTTTGTAYRVTFPGLLKP